jgi:hypothetical protein
MSLSKIQGLIRKQDNHFYINDLILIRSGNVDSVDKYLNHLLGYEVEAYGLLKNNMFFLRSFEIKGKKC